MKSTLFLIFLFQFSYLNGLLSQNEEGILLPYLQKNHYGVVDEKGDIVLPYEFQKVVIFNEKNLIFCLKDNLWGIYNLKGDLLLDHKIKREQGPSTNLPYIKTQLEYRVYERNKDFPVLYRISDKFTKTSYLINPEFPQENYAELSLSNEKNKDVYPYLKHLISEIYRVVQKNGDINFIDVKGRQIFQNGVEDGYVLSNNLFTVKKEGKYALHSKEKALTAPIYRVINQLETPGLYQGEHYVLNSEGNKQKQFHLINEKGEIIKKTFETLKSSRGFTIVSEDRKSTVYGAYGKLLYSFKNVEFSSYKFKDKDLLRTKKYNTAESRIIYGLLDNKGNFVLDTIYPSIDISFPYIIYEKDNHTTVLDSNLNVYLEFDSYINMRLARSKEHFIYRANDKQYDNYGILDIEGNEVLDPIWIEIYDSQCDNLAVCISDSSSSIYNLDSREVIYPKENVVAKFNYFFDCSRKLIRITNKEEEIIIDYNGNIKESPIRKIRSGRSASSHNKYTIKKINNKYNLQDSTGRFVLDKSYEYIEIVYNNSFDKVMYVCRHSNKGHPTTDVFNSDLKNIIPEGYSHPRRMTFAMKNMRGAIFVINDSDIEKYRYYFRSGVIDFDGNWIIQPFYGTFVDVISNLIIAKDKEKGLILYDKQGQRATVKKYDIIQDNIDSDISSNRIKVGVLKDKEYVKKAKKLSRSFFGKSQNPKNEEEIKQMIQKAKNLPENTYIEYLKELDKLGKPNVLYGFINVKGEEVIKPQYNSAGKFDETEKTAIVNIVKNGVVFTQKIDTLGNVIFSLPFQNFSPFKNGDFQVKSGEHWMISDSMGILKSPLKFRKIDLRNDILDGIYIGRDSIKTYLLSRTGKVLKEFENNKIEVKSINKHFFYVKEKQLIDGINKSKNQLFSEEMELIDTFVDIREISTKFEGSNLPKGYVTIRPTIRKPYLYNLLDRTALKN